MSLDSHRRALAYCSFCPKLCRFCCPTAEAEHRETVTPWGKMTLAGMVLANRLAPGPEQGEIFYHCLGCLHCRTHCRHEIDVPAALRSARQVVVKAGAEPPALARFLGVFRDSGNPWGEDLRARLHSIAPPEVFEPDSEAVLFAGCQAIRDPAGSLTATLRLLPRLGLDYLALFDGDALCCGTPFHDAGHHDCLLEHARKLRAELNRFRLVVCPCPTCAWTLGALYSELGLPLSAKVVHLAELLAPAIAEHLPERKVPGSFVFHDPCFLTRMLGQPELARQALGAILREPLRESNWRREDASCCGGGGLVPHLLPQVAREAAGLRMAQLRASGAERVVTACPGCVRMLGEVPGGLPTEDMVSVLIRAYLDESEI